MTFRQALKALEERQESKIELGLARVRAHLRRLGDPQRELACIHVAGTNGKGSLCAILESVLRQSGYLTGWYSSPHLHDVRERIRIDGRWIAKADFARLMGRALSADPENRLTYFELLTSVAFKYFSENRVDVVLLETGLGGRLDATNVIERPLACAITSIDFDHTQFLGNTLAKIAAEKAAIIKRDCMVFCPKLQAAALKVVKSRARRRGALLTVIDRPFRTVKVDWNGNMRTFRDPRGHQYRLSLLGDAQGSNLALARAILNGLFLMLPVKESAWVSGLSSVSWPGRFEVRRLGAKTAVLDGAHNPEAARQLARTWRDSPWSARKTRWIIGVMKDKDARGMLKAVVPYFGEVVTVRPPSPRAMDAVSLARLVREEAPRAHVTVERDPETAVRAWLAGAASPPTAVICGSFYLVGRAGEILSRGAHG